MQDEPLIVQAADPNVRIMGRYEADENGSVTLGFPGQEIVIVFSGDYVAMKGAVLTGDPLYFNVSLDGETLPKLELHQGDFIVTLVEGLQPKGIFPKPKSVEPEPPKKHTLRLVRRNESWQGVVRIDHFDLGDDGDLFLSPYPPSRKLLCIGDSITCGEATEQVPPSIEYGNQNANAELSYGWALAKHFDAQVHLVSYGGRGLTRTWDGKTDDINAPDFFERALPDDPDSKWDHSSYQPDLVTICLGQNDFTQGIVPEEVFVPAYIDFINRIQEVYPDAGILLLSSPMQGTKTEDEPESPLRTALESHIKKVVNHFREQGELNIRFHSVDWYPGTQYNAHPTGDQHAAMAKELEPVIAEMMDWR